VNLHARTRGYPPPPRPQDARRRPAAASTATAPGAADARSRWEMTSEQFRTPIIETESTNLYE